MTLGNHGWTGGIYNINREILILQIQDLITSNRHLNWNYKM
jgi:hypothetical protein